MTFAIIVGWSVMIGLLVYIAVASTGPERLWRLVRRLPASTFWPLASVTVGDHPAVASLSEARTYPKSASRGDFFERDSSKHQG